MCCICYNWYQCWPSIILLNVNLTLGICVTESCRLWTIFNNQHACKNMWKFLWLWNKRDKVVPMQACIGDGGACIVQLHAPCFSWAALWVELLWTSAEAGALFHTQESSESGRIWPVRSSVKWDSCFLENMPSWPFDHETSHHALL